MRASLFKVLLIPLPPTWRLCSSIVRGRSTQTPWCQKPNVGGVHAASEEEVALSGSPSSSCSSLVSSSPAVVETSSPNEGQVSPSSTDLKPVAVKRDSFHCGFSFTLSYVHHFKGLSVLTRSFFRHRGQSVPIDGAIRVMPSVSTRSKNTPSLCDTFLPVHVVQGGRRVLRRARSSSRGGCKPKAHSSRNLKTVRKSSASR